MVFKGRFFSSKKSDSSSPDGSHNSPRSFGSNSNSSSPIRSEKKKTKSLSPSLSKDSTSSSGSAAKSLLRKKDSSKGKESLTSPKVTSGLSASSSVVAKLRAAEAAAVEQPAPPNSVSVSPLVASSLGLNKIKTRSGPLPQESFFSFASREKGVALGSSNLSRPLGVGAGIAGSDGVLSGKKKKEKSITENLDNGSNSDGMSTESGASRDQSPHVFQAQARSRLQNADSSSSGAPGIVGALDPLSSFFIDYVHLQLHQNLKC